MKGLNGVIRKGILSAVVLILVVVAIPISVPTPVYATTDTFYGTATDGYAWIQAADNWADAWGGASATDLDSGTDVLKAQTVFFGAKYTCKRAFLYFDTSDLPDAAVISSATLYLYGKFKAEADVGDADLGVVEGIQQEPFVATDYGAHKIKTVLGAPYFTFATWNLEAYNSRALNATGRGWINVAGTTKFCLRISGDIDNNAPGGDSNGLNPYSFDNVLGKRPYLTITYTTVGVPSITTDAVDDILSTSATLNATIDATNGSNVIERGFEWDTDSGVPYAEDWTENGDWGAVPYDHGIAELIPDQRYYVRAKVRNASGWAYGEEVFFDALSAPVPGWLGVWGYRKRIDIEGSSSGALTDYTMKLVFYQDYGFVTRQSDEVSPVELEAVETVWVPEEGAAYSLLGSREAGYPDEAVHSSAVYKWVPGDGNPTKVADIPITVTETYIVWCPDTYKIYVYGGGGPGLSENKKIQWFDPSNNTTGICTEELPYSGFRMSCAYSTAQNKTYLIGGQRWWGPYVESKSSIYRHDPVAGTMTLLGATTPNGANFNMRAIYVSYQDRIYVFGGTGVQANQDDVFYFDCATETTHWLGNLLPSYKTKHQGGFYNSDVNVILLGGGRDAWVGGEAGYDKHIWAFDPETHQVTNMECTLGAVVDDLGGFYDTDSHLGYFLPVTPEGYEDLWDGGCHGDYQKYITEFTNLSGMFGGHCQDDFDDIRFCENDGDTEIDYWMESYTSGDRGDFWVEIPSIPTDDTFIYVYYGNDAVATTSDGDNTFILHDPFVGGAIDGGKWTETDPDGVISQDNKLIFAVHTDTWNTALYSVGNISRPFSFESKWRTNSASNKSGLGAKNVGAGVAVADWVYWLEECGDGKHDIQYSGASEATDLGAYEAGVDYWYRVAVPASGARFYQGDDGILWDLIYDGSTNGATDPLRVGFNSGTKAFELDWAGVRKYAFPEPEWGAGFLEEEETPTCRTEASSFIRALTARLNGDILAIGASNVTKYKFEWDTDTGVPYANNWESSVSVYDIGSYSHDIDSLTANTPYFFRFGAENGEGWAWGDERTFTTQAVGIQTNEVAGITGSTATLQGALTDLGGYSPIYCYFRWGETSAYEHGATVEQTKTAVGGFSQGIAGLVVGQEYHYRAFARYGTTDYEAGEDVMFIATSAVFPSVTTASVTSIVTNSATLQGVLNTLGDYGSVSVSFEYGQTTDYGLTTTPQTRTSTGDFSANITGLELDTAYHCRARVRYNSTYANGDDVSFSTLSVSLSPPTFFEATRGEQKIILSWEPDTNGDKTLVRRSTTGYPTSITSGFEVYFGAGSSTTDTGLSNAQRYYYSAWSEKNDNYSISYVTVYVPPAGTGAGILPTPDKMAIANVVIFSGYQQEGDQLICFDYKIIYNSGDPEQKSSDFFAFEVYDSGTLHSKTPVIYWGHKPASVYLAPTNTLEWGQAFVIKVRGIPSQWDIVPESSYPVSAYEWADPPTDLDALDTWVINTARLIDDDWLVYETTGYVLSDEAAEIFTNAIPALPAIRSAPFSYTMGFIDVELVEHDPAYQRELTTEHLGDYLIDRLDEAGAVIGVDEPETVGGMLLFLLAVLIAIIIGFKTKSPAFSLGSTMPIFIFGNWVGLIPVIATLVVVAALVLYGLYTIIITRA